MIKNEGREMNGNVSWNTPGFSRAKWWGNLYTGFRGMKGGKWSYWGERVILHHSFLSSEVFL